MGEKRLMKVRSFLIDPDTGEEVEVLEDDYEVQCDRCLRTRMRNQVRDVKGEKYTVLVCKEGCEFTR